MVTEQEMGRVTAEALVENLEDLWKARGGNIPDDQVRRVVISEAVVDTGARNLSLPTSIIDQLGLRRTGQRQMLTSNGLRWANRCDVARLTIMGRDCNVEVIEVPDGVPALIGQIPLEYLDFVVDPGRHRLIGNPDHNGELAHDEY